MSRTIFKSGSYRFYFFSREELRMHVHISCPHGEAKFWIGPIVSLATYHSLSQTELKKMQLLVEAHIHEICDAWKRHFAN